MTTDTLVHCRSELGRSLRRSWTGYIALADSTAQCRLTPLAVYCADQLLYRALITVLKIIAERIVQPEHCNSTSRVSFTRGRPTSAPIVGRR